MKNNAVRPADYALIADRSAYLDACILLTLHPPLGKSRPGAAAYSKLISDFIKADIKLKVSVPIVSEYVNAYARIVFNALYKNKYQNKFKNFRNSPDWKPYAKQIAGEVKSFLKYSVVEHTLSDNESIIKHLDHFASGGSDFNDQIIVEGCQLSSADLVTHDGDMQNGGITVVTENGSLISSCP